MMHNNGRKPTIGLPMRVVSLNIQVLQPVLMDNSPVSANTVPYYRTNQF